MGGRFSCCRDDTINATAHKPIRTADATHLSSQPPRSPSAHSSESPAPPIEHETSLLPVVGWRPTQPELDPSRWFLSESELTASRGGHRRQGLSVFTTANNVEAFPSTAQYFAALLDDLEAADRIWIAGWSLNIDVPLDPRLKAPGKQHTMSNSLREVLTRAFTERAAEIRALIWASTYHRAENITARDWMNALAPPSIEGDPHKRTKGSALLVFDDRLPRLTSSHHQKFVLVQCRDGPVIAYLGGIDISQDRWDTVAHDQGALRREAGIRARVDGWIDAGIRVLGPAVGDVVATFLARWNSARRPCLDLDDHLLAFRNPAFIPPLTAPKVLASSDPDPATCRRRTPSTTNVATASMQIVRTFSPSSVVDEGLYPEFAPRGELSLLHGRLRAIRQARNFIYVEDQYFYLVPDLQTALLEVLPRLRRLLIVIQRPDAGLDAQVLGAEKLVFNMAQPLVERFPTKVSLYVLSRTTHGRGSDVYLHSKLVIIDDVYLSVGSGNWNRRSMTSDAELTANVVDATSTVTGDGIAVSSWIRGFRLARFAELSGRRVSPDSLRAMALAESLELLEPSGSGAPWGVERFVLIRRRSFRLFPRDYALNVVDPDDTFVDAADGRHWHWGRCCWGGLCPADEPK